MGFSNAIGAVNEVRPSGIAGFATNVVESLKAHELNIERAFNDGLLENAKDRNMPAHIAERFRVWEQSFTSPEDLAKVSEVKQRVTEMMRSTSDYVTSQIERKTQTVQLELAMKAVAKGTQGIQQLLSSQ